MSSLGFKVKGLINGESVTRIELNHRLSQEVLSGRILDLGAGKRDMYSTKIPQTEDATYELMDIKMGEKVDFETDRLPYDDSVFDNVILFNVLEHIYNHQHLIDEVHRIVKLDGTLVGFVPFLMWYHPDHHDYFRYTHEALEKILKKAGFSNISVESIHIGPYSTAFQMIYPTVPRILRPLFALPFLLLDLIFNLIRPKSAARYALGYYFKAQK